MDNSKFMARNADIYQAKNGSIQLRIGNRKTELTIKQINELCLPLYDLVEEIDVGGYNNHYQIKVGIKNES